MPLTEHYWTDLKQRGFKQRLHRLVGLTLILGCRGDAKLQVPQPSPSNSRGRDTSGVGTLESTQLVSDLPVAFRIAEAPTLDLGGARNPTQQELGPGEHASARLSDGRIVVGERTSLKVFGPDGRYVSTIGRAGKGPGEFRYVYGVCVAPGDLIVGIDGHRVSVFANNGDLIRTFARPGLEFVRSGCLGDGSLLATAAAPLRDDPANVGFRLTTVRRVGLDGSDLGLVGDLPFGGSPSAGAYVPTSAGLVAHGNEIFVGDGRRPEIRVYGIDGALKRIIRWNAHQIPLTDELLMRIARAVDLGASDDSVRARLARRRAAGLPRTLPAYAQFGIDGVGRIWVQDYYLGRLLGNFPPPWTVFDSSGRPLGRVVFPTIAAAGKGSADIRSFDGNAAVITWKDSQMGFPHLSFHQITPAK